MVELVEARARVYGVNTALALYVADHESGFDPQNVGDEDIICPNKRSKFYGRPVYARGVFQFTRCYFDWLSDEDAFDPIKNIDLAMPLLNDKKTCMMYFTTCRWFYRGKT